MHAMGRPRYHYRCLNTSSLSRQPGLDMPFPVLPLPIPVIVHVLRCSTGAEAVALLFTAANSAGEGLYTIQHLQRGSWLVLTACFDIRAPLFFQVIGVYRLAWTPRGFDDRYTYATDEAVLRDLGEWSEDTDSGTEIGTLSELD